MRRWTVFLCVSLLVCGCSKGELKPVPKTASKNVGTSWSLVETEPPTLNAICGEVGRIVRVAADGTIVGGGMTVKWMIEGVALDPEKGTNYQQSLDFHGPVTTSWTQKIGGREFHVKSVTELPRPGARQTWTIQGNGAFQYSVDPGTLTSLAQTSGSATKELSAEFIEPIDMFGILAMKSNADIEIDGPLEDQQAIRSFIYYLQAIYGVSQKTYSPMEGTNEAFKDRTFWDADVWLIPALVFFEPGVAESIAHVRIDAANSKVYDQWVKKGRPTAKHETSEQDNGLASMAKAKPIKYAWQAGSNGEELSDQPTRFAEHVSGDVAWGVSFASDLGLVAKKDAQRVIDGVASYYLHRAKLGNDSKVGILDTVSVDEWHTGDDDLYTNALMDWVVRRSVGDELWPADAMRFPNDYGGLLAYEGDARKAYQQAAAQLLIWPLEMEGTVGDPIRFLDRFEGKEAETGPAMSLSIDALIRARFGSANAALGTWRESWRRYTEGNPFLLFSEKPGQSHRTYFATGAAGCLNTVLYGFCGARIVEDASKDSAKIKVANGKWLVFRPNLPNQWKRLSLCGITVMGKRYDVDIVGRTATIIAKDK